MAPKALSTALARAQAAHADSIQASGVLRQAAITQAKTHAADVTRTRLDTETTEDNWEALRFPGLRLVVALDIAPGVRVGMVSGSSDLLLMTGNDPTRWQTIRDLTHLGQLVDERGLVPPAS